MPSVSSTLASTVVLGSPSHGCLRRVNSGVGTGGLRPQVCSTLLHLLMLVGLGRGGWCGCSRYVLIILTQYYWPGHVGRQQFHKVLAFHQGTRRFATFGELSYVHNRWGGKISLAGPRDWIPVRAFCFVLVARLGKGTLLASRWQKRAGIVSKRAGRFDQTGLGILLSYKYCTAIKAGRAVFSSTTWTKNGMDTWLSILE